MSDGDARDSVIALLVTCRTYLKCSNQESVTDNRIHPSDLSGLGHVTSWGEEVFCVLVCVCIMSLMLLYLVCKGKEKKLVLMCPRSVEGVSQRCCGVKQRLKKDAALTVVAATGKR